MAVPLVMPPDYENLVIDYLTAHLNEPGTTIGIGVPDGWTPSDTAPHISVGSFSVSAAHPVLYRPIVRLVAAALSPTRAKFIAAKALGVMCAHPGGNGLAGVRTFRGPDLAYEPATHTELCSVELQVAARSIPIP